MMSSANLLEAFKALIHLAPLLGNGFTLHMQPEGKQLRLWVEKLPEPGGVERCRASEDMGFASLLGFSRWLTGNSLPRLRETAFTYPEPEDTTMHQALFDCDLRFGADRSSIVFDLATLTTPLNTSNAALALLHRQVAEHRLGQLTEASYSEQIRSYLVQHITLGIYDLDSAAIRLRVNKRTLQRELSNEGTNLKEVLDEARRQLAEHYLRYSSHSLAQVGELVGFKEPSSFHKASQRWFNMPPGRYRSLSSDLLVVEPPRG